MKSLTRIVRHRPLESFLIFAFVLVFLYCTFRAVSMDAFFGNTDGFMHMSAGKMVEYIPDVQKKRARAVIVILARNRNVYELRETLVQFEDRINGKLHYPYVFLNDEPFNDLFKQSMSQLLIERNNLGKLHPTRNISFGIIPHEHWSYPEWIDQQEAADVRERMRNICGPSESYRHMCRYYSGFFYRHPLLAQYEYYWRIEPSVQFYCDIDYDPFVYMMENGKEYSFTMTFTEKKETIPTLWNTTKKYLKEIYPNFRQHRLLPVKSPALKLILKAKNSTDRDRFIEKLLASQDPNEQDYSVSWTFCHYCNNFEIAHLDFFRSPLYQSYFDYLDKAGGFFYERWGDSPVHSLAANIFLESSQIHYFSDIGYRHNAAFLCPIDKDAAKCYCNVNSLDNVVMSKTRRQCLDLWLAGQEL